MENYQRLQHLWKKMGKKKKIIYEYPKHHWEKNNFSIRYGYKDFVGDLLNDMSSENKNV